MSLATIRAGMAQVIDVIDEANVYGHLPGNPQLPCVVVGWPQSWTLGTAQQTAVDYVIPVEVLVAFTHPESADDTLLTLLDEVVDAMGDNPSFGATCDDSMATQVTQIGVVDIDGDRKALAATVLVQVYA